MRHILSEKNLRVFSQICFTAVIIVFFLLLVATATYYYFANSLKSKEALMNRNDVGVTLYDRNHVPFFTFYQAQEKTEVPISQISPSMQEAVIASEDREFYHHPGFSIPAIARSLYDDIRLGRQAYGGSTITQQLVKNALLNNNKNFLRKYQEIVLAHEVERRYSKNEILEMYLNSVYFGEGAFGVEEAAQKYFGKSAKNLDPAQSALLAGLLPAPSLYSPISGNAQQAHMKKNEVLNAMHDMGYLTDSQYNNATSEKLIFQPSESLINTKATHFALMVRDLLIQKYGEENISRSGFRVTTSLDLTDEQVAQNAVQKQVARLLPDNVHNGAAVVEDPTNGEILAMVGSVDWTQPEFGKVNMAITPRQPGSSFKPIVYAAALEQHAITAATQLKDEPTTFPGGYKPLDYDRKFRGIVLARRALSNSLNIPSVEVLEKIGIPAALDEAKKFGITTLGSPDNYGLSLVLGTGEVKLTELTNVYAMFSQEGQEYQPTAILEIKDKNNNDVYKYSPSSNQVVDPGAAYIISSILSDNQTRAEEFGNLLNISRLAAVKTGTTENYRDAWTLGYTPQLAVGVWVGNNDNQQMDTVAGSLGAAPIWREIMEALLISKPVMQFPIPADVEKHYVCRSNGFLAVTATTSAYLEYFLQSTTPVQTCTSAPLTTTVPSAIPSSSVTVTVPATASPPSVAPSHQAPTSTSPPPGQEKKEK